MDEGLLSIAVNPWLDKATRDQVEPHCRARGERLMARRQSWWDYRSLRGYAIIGLIGLDSNPVQSSIINAQVT